MVDVGPYKEVTEDFQKLVRLPTGKYHTFRFLLYNSYLGDYSQNGIAILDEIHHLILAENLLSQVDGSGGPSSEQLAAINVLDGVDGGILLRDLVSTALLVGGRDAYYDINGVFFKYTLETAQGTKSYVEARLDLIPALNWTNAQKTFWTKIYTTWSNKLDNMIALLGG